MSRLSTLVSAMMSTITVPPNPPPIPVDDDADEEMERREGERDEEILRTVLLHGLDGTNMTNIGVAMENLTSLNLMSNITGHFERLLFGPRGFWLAGLAPKQWRTLRQHRRILNR